MHLAAAAGPSKAGSPLPGLKCACEGLRARERDDEVVLSVGGRFVAALCRRRTEAPAGAVLLQRPARAHRRHLHRLNAHRRDASAAWAWVAAPFMRQRSEQQGLAEEVLGARGD